MLSELDGETSIRNTEVPGAMVEVAGNRYTVRIDPLALPDEVMSATGMVSFDVYAQDPTDPFFSMTSVSVRAVVTAQGESAWTEPTDPTVDLTTEEGASRAPTAAIRHWKTTGHEYPTVRQYADEARVVEANVSKPTAEGVICDSEGCAPTRGAGPRTTFLVPSEASSGVGDDDETETGRFDAPVMSDVSEGGTSCPPGGLGDVYTTKRRVSTTIGTAYPIAKDTAWMTHTNGSSANFTTTVGVAWNNLGSFQQSGTRTVERGSGFEWDPKSYARSFRVGVVYQKVKAMFDRCGGQPYYVRWVPVGYRGGFGENTNGVSRPNWKHCVKITSTGIWWRKQSGGAAYTNNGGVKFAGVIGIDLSSARAYNAEAKLAYRIRLAGRRMCGSNTYPGNAAKVMERAKL